MDLLSTVTVVPLDKHNLLSNFDALRDRAEPENVANSRIRLLVPVGDTHTSSGGDVEAGKVTVLVNDGDEADVVCEDIDIVVWWDCDCNLVLHWGSVLQALLFLTAEHTLRGR